MKKTVKITRSARRVLPVSSRESLRTAQERCRPYLTGPGLLSEELIQERRAEARQELEP